MLVPLLVFFLFSGSYAREEIHEWIYESVDKYAVNFRNLNGTHEFGSSSSPDGAYGVIHLISSKDDAVSLVNDGLAGPYVAVLLEDTFNKEIMEILIKSDKISGIIITQSSKAPSNYSFDSECPNSNSEVTSCKINPYGNSFLLKNWPFPLVLVENAASVKAIMKCYYDFNVPFDSSQLNRRLCSLHLKNHMFAAVSSEVCMRRNGYLFNAMKYCDPLGGQNIILPSSNFWSKKKETIILSARLDIASMFDGIAPGAMSSVTGIVTLLAASHILSHLLPNYDSGDKSIIFIFFNGEAYDYIGSSRIVYDMKKGLFPYQDNPLSLEEISLFIDINQLSYNPLYLRTKNTESRIAKMFIDKFISYGAKNNFTWIDTNLESYIPSSFQSFSKHSSSLPGIVIANYNHQFTNSYYHGLYDTADNIKFVYQNGSEIDSNSIQFYLATVAEGIAVSLHQLMTGKEYNKDDLKNGSYPNLIDELLHCYLESNHCKYMNAVITKDIKIKEEPESLYVGVGRGSDVITKLTGRMLAYLTSPVISAKAENCTIINDTSKPYSYIWMNGLSGDGVCINSTLKFTTAVSPAFDIEDYNWTSGQYSTWTESAWQDLDVFMFLKPPASQELVTLITGIIILCSSFVFVYWLNKENSRHSTAQTDQCF